MTDALRAASYARTSTVDQKSCNAQQELCRELIDKRSWKQHFRLQDEGQKGASTDRPGYQHLLELVEDERIDVAVTWKLDRMFRSLKEASSAQELFQQHKVAIVSYTEPFDTTTPIGRFVFGFLANVAQFETALIKERAHLGYARRTMEGKWTGARVPFAYRRDEAGRLAVEDAEKEVVVLMHRTYGRVKGDMQLASWLNDKGYTHRGDKWNTDRVRKVLTNPISIGDLTVRGVMSHHDHLAIVSRARFQQTQRQRSELLHVGTHLASEQRQEAVNRVFDAYLEDLRTEAPE